MSEPEMTEYDMWEWTGAFWYRPLPEETLDQFVSGETEIITITKEGDIYWLNDRRKQGESDFSTLEEAKAAGDLIVEGAHIASNEKVVRSVGLDPNEWEFASLGDDAWFDRGGDLDIKIDRQDGKWLLKDGSNVCCEAETVRDAVKFYETHVAPSRVEKTYDFLGNIYGHEITGAVTESEEEELRILRSMYDNAILHDRGWPVRSLAMWRIGFLAIADCEGSTPDDAALKAFSEKFGCKPEPVSKWQGKDVSYLVCFVPMEKISQAAEISDELVDLARPKPAPGN